MKIEESYLIISRRPIVPTLHPSTLIGISLF